MSTNGVQVVSGSQQTEADRSQLVGLVVQAGRSLSTLQRLTQQTPDSLCTCLCPFPCCHGSGTAPSLQQELSL